MPKKPKYPNRSGLSESSHPGPKVALRISLMALAIVLFLASRWYIFFQLEPAHTDLRTNYFEYAGKVYDFALVPYQEFVPIEYPPLAWWTIYAPRMLDARRVSDPRDKTQVAPVYQAYRRAFRGQMFLFDLISLLLLTLIVHVRRPAWTEWATLGYVATTASLGYVLYDRLDVGLALLLLLWAFCWIRSLDESESTIAWTAAAYSMLGLSISYKLIPVIILPFLLLAECRAPRWYLRVPTALFATATAAALPFVIQYAVSGPAIFSLFKYHSERGIEIESIYSTLMMIGSLFGPPIYVQLSHGAYELAGVLANDMRILSNVLLLGFISALTVWSLWQGPRYSRLQAYRMALFVICSSVILAKVFSPQYLLWTIPAALLLAAEILPSRGAARRTLLTLLIVVVGLTCWIYPSHYLRRTPDEMGLVPVASMSPGELSALPCVILGLRNLTYLGVMAWLGVTLLRPADHGGVSNTDRPRGNPR